MIDRIRSKRSEPWGEGEEQRRVNGKVSRDRMPEGESAGWHHDSGRLCDEPYLPLDTYADQGWMVAVVNRR